MKKIGFKEGGYLTGKNPYIIVAIFSFLIYGNTIFNKYNLDDELVTTVSESKPHRLTSKGVSAIPEIFKSNYYEDAQGYSYDYRPIVLSTFAIEHSLFGSNPHVGHFINTLLYSLLCMLLLLTLTLLLEYYNPMIPLLITLFFAAFPMHTEVVASLKNRDEILALTGGLATLYFFLHYIDRRNLVFLLAGMLCFLAGMLSKQTIISFAIIIPMLLFLFREVSIFNGVVTTVLLCGMIFPLIQREILVDRISIIAGVMLFSAVFYAVRYQQFFKRIKLSNNFPQRVEKIPEKRKPSSDIIRFNADLSLTPKIFILLLTGLMILTVLLLACGSTLYLLPLSILIPLFLFPPFEKWRYFSPFVSAGIALYIAIVFGQSDVFNGFFLLYIFCFLRRNEIKIFELVSCILIALTIVFLEFEPGSGRGLNFSEPIWNLILFGGIAGMIYMPSRKVFFATVAFSPIAFVAISALLPDGILNFENFVNVYFYNLAGFYFLAVFLLFYFPRQVKMIVILISVYILSLTLIHRQIAATFPEVVKEKLVEFKHDLGSGFKKEFHQLKGTLTEATNEVATYKYVNPIQGFGEENAFRPIEYVESVISSKSSASEKLGTGMIVIGNYIRLTLIPYPMSFYYGYKYIDKTALNQPIAILVLCIVVTSIIFALLRINKNRLLSIGLLIYFITLLPLANIIAPVPGMIADRYLFIPSLGFCILLTLALCKLAKFPVKKGIPSSFPSFPKNLIFPALGILVLYSGVTLARNYHWYDSLRIMRHDIGHLEESAQAQNLLATHLVQESLIEKQDSKRLLLLEEAEGHYEKAVGIYPDFFNAQYDLGRVRMMLGKEDKAEKCFLKVIEIDSAFSEPFLQVGLIKASRGNCREALPYYHQYLKINPANLDALMNLSFCYARLQDFPSALIPMKKAAVFYPQQPDPLIYLCRIYADMGRIDSAVFYLQRAETIAPRHPDIQMLKNALTPPTSAGAK